MLTRKEAKKIGIRACVDKIGYEFCKKHEDNGTSAYGLNNGKMDCFVGVSDKPAGDCDIEKVESLILTSGKKWPYYAHCEVDMETGEIEYGECRIPEKIE